MRRSCSNLGDVFPNSYELWWVFSIIGVEPTRLACHVCAPVPQDTDICAYCEAAVVIEEREMLETCSPYECCKLRVLLENSLPGYSQRTQWRRCQMTRFGDRRGERFESH